MCITVRYAETVTTPWDLPRWTITLPADLSPHLTALAARTVLSELGFRQPAEGAVCWCGRPINLSSSRIPAQRDSSEDPSSGT